MLYFLVLERLPGMKATVLIQCFSVVFGGTDPMYYEHHEPVPIRRNDFGRVRNKLWAWRKKTIERESMSPEQDRQMTEFIKMTIDKMSKDMTIPYSLNEAIEIFGINSFMFIVRLVKSEILEYKRVQNISVMKIHQKNNS